MQQDILAQNDRIKLVLWQMQLLWRPGIWKAEDLLRKKDITWQQIRTNHQTDEDVRTIKCSSQCCPVFCVLKPQRHFVVWFFYPAVIRYDSIGGLEEKARLPPTFLSTPPRAEEEDFTITNFAPREGTNRKQMMYLYGCSLWDKWKIATILLVSVPLCATCIPT